MVWWAQRPFKETGDYIGDNHGRSSDDLASELGLNKLRFRTKSLRVDLY